MTTLAFIHGRGRPNTVAADLPIDDSAVGVSASVSSKRWVRARRCDCWTFAIASSISRDHRDRDRMALDVKGDGAGRDHLQAVFAAISAAHSEQQTAEVADEAFTAQEKSPLDVAR